MVSCLRVEVRVVHPRCPSHYKSDELTVKLHVRTLNFADELAALRKEFVQLENTPLVNTRTVVACAPQ